jgi:hypothetical protein
MQAEHGVVRNCVIFARRKRTSALIFGVCARFTSSTISLGHRRDLCLKLATRRRHVGPPEHANHVVDNLIREMLFAEVNRIKADMVGEREGIHFINWVPDTWTLLQILQSQPKQEIRCIAYPGDGLPRMELDRLLQLFPDLSLISFEELRRGSASPQTVSARRGRKPESERLPVMLSISNPSPQDLGRRGMYVYHLDDTTIRLARALLLNDFDVIYGGRPREGFTEGFQDDSGTVVMSGGRILAL